MRRLATALTALAAGAAALVLAGASGGGSSEGRSYRVVLDNAFGLVVGGDFRVGGVRAGQTTDFDVSAPPGRG